MQNGGSTVMPHDPILLWSIDSKTDRKKDLAWGWICIILGGLLIAVPVVMVFGTAIQFLFTSSQEFDHGSDAFRFTQLIPVIFGIPLLGIGLEKYLKVRRIALEKGQLLVERNSSTIVYGPDDVEHYEVEPFRSKKFEPKKSSMPEVKLVKITMRLKKEQKQEIIRFLYYDLDFIQGLFTAWKQRRELQPIIVSIRKRMGDSSEPRTILKSE